SLLDAALFDAGAARRQGKVDDGTSVLDYEPEENRRKLSISSALAAVEWRGCKLNFIDTPGYPDFIGEMLSALSVSDGALIVVSAPSGMETGTEKAWLTIEDMGLPRAIFVNKIDREHADFDKTVDELRARFGTGVVPVQLPIGKEESFQGVADLLTLHMKIVTHEDEELVTDIPEYMQEAVEEARQQLIEALADFDDQLMEKFLEGEEIPEEEIREALAAGVRAAKVFPVFCGSATQNIGVKKLLKGLGALMPPPERTFLATDAKSGEPVERSLKDSGFAAQVFKTIVDPFVGRLSFMRIVSGDIKGDGVYYNPTRDTEERISGLATMQGKQQIPLPKAHAGDIVVVSKLTATKTGDTLTEKAAPVTFEPFAYPGSMLVLAASPAKKGEEDKVFSAIGKEGDQDPTILIVKNKETKETLVRGIGEVQLEILKERIERKYGAKVEFSQPKVPLRETIRKSVKVEGKHKKQSGGHGQYGHVWLEISPQPAGEGNAFTETIFGGSVPRQYIPAVEKGTEETLAAGILAGFPVVDVKVNLYDGSYHTVDSSEAAFKTATALALKKGVMDASPALLEPIYNMTVTAPEYFMGEVMGQLNTKRAKIMGMESKGRDMSEVKAQIPELELYKYATELRSQTKGRGDFTVEFSHYEEMPQKLAEEMIKKYQEEKDKK
ncbi:MAG: elongation factor G, partial [Schwartzia sp.]|nr:elongation factor G [Schwartzia sp. (in: firmicutes)]